MGVTHVPPGGGKSVWIANNELVTFKEMGRDTGGEFALVEVVGLPGSGPFRTSTTVWTRSTASASSSHTRVFGENGSDRAQVRYRVPYAS